MDPGCPVRGVRMNQARGGGVLDRAVARSHLEGTFNLSGQGDLWEAGVEERKRKGSRLLGVTAWGLNCRPH